MVALAKYAQKLGETHVAYFFFSQKNLLSTALTIIVFWFQDAEENKAPASFVLQKAPLRRTQFDQIKPFETIKVVKRPAPESQPIDDKSSELSRCPKPSHHIEVNRPRLPATDDAKNNNDESQILKRREVGSTNWLERISSV